MKLDLYETDCTCMTCVDISKVIYNWNGLTWTSISSWQDCFSYTCRQKWNWIVECIDAKLWITNLTMLAYIFHTMRIRTLYQSSRSLELFVEYFFCKWSVIIYESECMDKKCVGGSHEFDYGNMIWHLEDFEN